MGRVRDDRFKFIEAFKSGGMRFVRDKVDPEHQKPFGAAFDELIKLECQTATLASTIFYFCQTQTLGDTFSFPSAQVIRKCRRKLVEAVDMIRQLDDYSVMEELARHAKIGEKLFAYRDLPPDPDLDPDRPWLPPANPDRDWDPELDRAIERDLTPDRQKLIDGLEWHIRALPRWQVPRKDIVESYAPIACCLYSEIATGNVQYPLVAQLLECLGYKPNPARQGQTKDKPRGEGDSFADSMRRNFNNFERRYPIVCKRLKTYLIDDHKEEKYQYQERYDHLVGAGYNPDAFVLAAAFPHNHKPVDWVKVFAPANPKK